jgi:glycosyltransferase involved in cell wall biosynthesis
MPEVSIIVPTKDEPTAPALVRRLKGLFPGSEIIIVDKSSAGNRKELAGTGARVIAQESSGYENALMEGFRAATGSVLATIDADGTYYAEDLKRVIDELGKGASAFVSGSREKREKGAMTGTISFGNAFLTGLFNFLYRRRMRDVLSGSFAMTRKAFDSIRDEQPYRAGTIFFEIELARRGFAIRNIPIKYGMRRGAPSRITKAKPFYGLTMAYHAVRYARDYNPLLLFGSTGVVLIIIGLAVGAFVLANYFVTGTLVDVGRALVAFMFVVLGFLSIIAGLILDLLLEVERKLYREKQ